MQNQCKNINYIYIYQRNHCISAEYIREESQNIFLLKHIFLPIVLDTDFCSWPQREKQETKMGFTRILFLTLLFVWAADVQCQNVRIFNVKKYGAIPDGKTENSKVNPSFDMHKLHI
jgi:hypothetical protein